MREANLIVIANDDKSEEIQPVKNVEAIDYRGVNNLDQQPVNSPEASEASLIKPPEKSPVLDKPKRVKIKTSQCKIFQKPVKGVKGVQTIVVDRCPVTNLDPISTEKEPVILLKDVEASSKNTEEHMF